MTFHRYALLAASLLALAACKPTAETPAKGETQAVADTAADATAKAIQTELDQGWTPANRDVWYEQTQGSRLMPLSWFLALEDRDGKPFLSEENVKRWGYLPHVNKQGRPLPIGFTEDVRNEARLPQPTLKWRKAPTAADRVWVGMNCAACHTAQLTYASKTLTVDGGPALSDFEGFQGELRAALDATEKDDARFGRFADRVLGEKPLELWKPGLHPVDAVKGLLTKDDSDDKANRALLRAAVAKIAARERELARLNASTGASDYGRLDAFGHIFNKVAMIVAAPNQAPSPSDAPVSYPFLWNVPQHDRVQWNGIAPKAIAASGEDFGALVRNAGEVVGVFGDIQVRRLGIGYPSSVDVPGLYKLEHQLHTLKPPAWPASIFGWNEIKDANGAVVATHDKLVADGRKLYGEPGSKDGRCVQCHQLLRDRTDLDTPIAAQMAMFNPTTKAKGNIHPSSGTDIWMACNAYTKTALTGQMEGELLGKIGKRADISEMLKVTVLYSLARQGEALLGALQNAAFKGKITTDTSLSALVPPPAGVVDRKAAAEQRCLKEVDPTLGYKGRPLNGIWATAPYLHNGSVRTLYQLLLPPAQRETAFEVGNREFDPKQVGYVSSTDANHSTLKAVEAGQPVRGNSNAGHDYGNAGFSDYDRWALIEFMKTL